jgi:hypothetical protein
VPPCDSGGAINNSNISIDLAPSIWGRCVVLYYYYFTVSYIQCD